MHRFLIVVPAATLCARCAAMAASDVDHSDTTCHYAHMQSVEKAARASHLNVTWVNCPRVPNKPTPEGTPASVATLR